MDRKTYFTLDGDRVYYESSGGEKREFVFEYRGKRDTVWVDLPPYRYDGQKQFQNFIDNIRHTIKQKIHDSEDNTSLHV